MTTNEALNVIFECVEYGVKNKWGQSMDYEWGQAMAHITNQLGVVYDEETQQWVTADTGDVI